jgi:D-amino peptidase
MRIWICTDMEGISGIDHWDQCYDPDDRSPVYHYGRQQLTWDTNAAIAGCFDAGADEVYVLDGHGRNANKGFLPGLDPRCKRVWASCLEPVIWEKLDGKIDGVAVIGQHAMAGTVGGFLDHTQWPKVMCRLTVNGKDIGEPCQIAAYGADFGVPYVYASGDEAFCVETKRLYPHVVTTPTKKGTGWATCELYDTAVVRRNIRADIARSVRGLMGKGLPIIKPTYPARVEIEFAYSEPADAYRGVPGVERVNARTVAWTVNHGWELSSVPSMKWWPGKEGAKAPG